MEESYLGSYYLPTIVLFSPTFLLISFPFFSLNLFFNATNEQCGGDRT